MCRGQADSTPIAGKAMEAVVSQAWQRGGPSLKGDRIKVRELLRTLGATLGAAAVVDLPTRWGSPSADCASASIRSSVHIFQTPSLAGCVRSR